MESQRPPIAPATGWNSIGHFWKNSALTNKCRLSHLIGWYENICGRNRTEAERISVYMSKKVCLIAGVGPGTGMECANRFSRGGYQVAMLARDKKRLNSLEKEIKDSHGYE